ncbi:MAG: hydrolase [Thiohalospira sp.]
MPLEESPFRPAWWLPGPHAQTLWPHFFRRPPRVATTPERLELDDGDFIDLAHGPGPAGAPRVLLLHGLEGSLDSQYARGMMAALARHGLRSVFMHWRGCSGEPNRLARSYHSGATDDIARVAAHLRDTEPATPLAAIGWSLGGNALLKWLGETGAANPLTAAAAISAPFRLERAAARMGRGFSRLYQWRLVADLRASLEAKRRLRGLDLPRPPRGGFRAFDDAVTAPLHGFRDANDYYARASSRPWLGRIAVPTRILHARDDPFMDPGAIPQARELAPAVILELAHRGGHVGFVEGRLPGRARYYAEQRIPAWLAGELSGKTPPARR